MLAGASGFGSKVSRWLGPPNWCSRMQDRARHAERWVGVAPAWAAKNDVNVNQVAPSAPDGRKRCREIGEVRKSSQLRWVECGMRVRRVTTMEGESALHRGGSGPNFVQLPPIIVLAPEAVNQIHGTASQ